MLKRITSVMAVVFFLIFANATSAAPKETYSIKLLEYGGINNYPKSGLVYGAHNQGTTYLPFFYNLIQSKDHNILFDIGYRDDAEDGQKDWSTLFGGENIEDPATVLKKVHLTPEDIDTVILSHLHFDHAGNIDQFPNAQFYVQKEELAGWLDSLKLPDKVRNWAWLATDINHINDLLKVSSENRLTLIDRDGYEVVDGVKTYMAKGHTFGTQGVTVETREGTYALAQDVVYTFEKPRIISH